MTLEVEALTLTPPGGRPLFPAQSFAVAPGEVLTLTGPSGAGKSSLLAAIGGHLAPGFTVSGQVRLNGRDLTGLPAEARQVGVMFQDALLFPHLSVGDNLAFGLRPGVRGRAARARAVAEALASAGLAGMGARDPATLSGGQKARAALMRTLLAGPSALLLDEPFTGLDPELRAGIRAFTFGHIRALGLPAVMVSHDPEDAAAALGPVIRLEPDAGQSGGVR